jgi:hypothetical protein
MVDREAYIAAVSKDVASQNVGHVVTLIGDRSHPFWLRRQGLECVMESADDIYAITVFNRLFLPITKGYDEETALLAEWWLGRERKVAAPRRLLLLRPYIEQAARYADMPSRLLDAALGVFAIWTQQQNTLAGWSEIARINALLRQTFETAKPEVLVDSKILRSVLWAGNHDVMLAYAELASRLAVKPDQRSALHYIMANLVSYYDRSALRTTAQAVHSLDPHHPTAIHNLAQVCLAEGEDALAIAKLYEDIDHSLHPAHFVMTLDWLAQLCFEKGYKAKAQSLFAQLRAAEAEDDRRPMNWLQNQLLEQRDAFARHAKSGDPTLHGIAGELPSVFREPVERAIRIAEGDMTWKSGLTVSDIAEAYRQIRLEVEAIARPVDASKDCENAAQKMVSVARQYFEAHLAYIDVSPVPLAEKYGRIDLNRHRAVYLGLMSLAAAAAEIGLQSLLAGIAPNSMENCLKLLEYYVTGKLKLGCPDEALAKLRNFEPFEQCRPFVRRLRELCLLELGDVDAINRLLSASSHRRSEVFQIADRQEWAALERLEWSTAVEDPETTSAFDVSWPDGSVSSYEHIVPATRLASASGRRLTVRRGEILRGDKDRIMRPERLHYPIIYPSNIPGLIATGKRGVHISRPGQRKKISEPLLVLENFDALHHRNYYHWLVLVLPRLEYIRRAGLLNDRRVLIPDQLDGWMHATRRAIGISDDQVLVADLDTELELEDVQLISSVEFASPSLLRGLVDTILPPDEVADEKDSPYLFLSRRDQARRPLLNAEEIESIAHDIGFQVIAPETLPFVEQARLFRRAAGVAGPEGAAMANIIFCKQGVRTLSMANANDLFPTYNDLAAVMTLGHRKLGGAATKDDYNMEHIWASFWIDPKNAERDLRWVMGA